MGRLEGKVAIITGGTSGIGARAAEIFVAEGAEVLIAGRRVREGEDLARRLGAKAGFLRTDVTQESDIKSMIDWAIDRHRRIDCIFNNAGGPTQGGSAGIEALTADAFDSAMTLLLRSVFLGMKYVAPIMKQQGRGSIINCASIAGLRTGYAPHLYSAAKAAVVHFTKTVAMELGESGIRVNSISPGAIATGIFAKAAGMTPERADQTAPAVAAVFKSRQPIQRAGLPEDIAHAALFLASDESSFINGHDLVVDGGIIGGRGWSDALAGRQALAKAIEQRPNA